MREEKRKGERKKKRRNEWKKRRKEGKKEGWKYKKEARKENMSNNNGCTVKTIKSTCYRASKAEKKRCVSNVQTQVILRFRSRSSEDAAWSSVQGKFKVEWDNTAEVFKSKYTLEWHFKILVSVTADSGCVCTVPQGDSSDPFYICTPDPEHFFNTLHVYFSHNIRVKCQVDAQ